MEKYNEYDIKRHIIFKPISGEKMLVHNKISGESFELGKKETEVLQLINGSHTAKQISSICGFFSEAEVEELELQLAKIGIIGKDNKSSRKLLKIKLPVLCPDEIFKDKRLINLLFASLIFVYGVFIMLAIAQAIYHLFYGTSLEKINLIEVFSIDSFSIPDVIAMYFIIVFSMINHEFSHIITARHYDISVPDAGFMLYLLLPCAYTNLTMINYTGETKKKLLTLSAGLYADIGMAGVAMTLFNCMPNGVLTKYYLFAALYSMVSVLWNLCVFVKYDGYYIIQILLNEHNLRNTAMECLKTTFVSSLYRIRNRNKMINSRSANADNEEMKHFYCIYAVLSVMYIPIILVTGIIPMIIKLLGGMI